MNNPKQKTQHLVERLFVHGISESVARRLVNADPEEVERQLEALPFRKGEIKNPAPYLIKAISEHYSIPPSVQKKIAMAEKNREAEQTAIQKKGFQEQRDKYQGMYFDYLRSEIKLLEETDQEDTFNQFEKVFQHLDIVAQRLEPDDRQALRLAEFENFISERPELHILTFFQWLEQLNPDPPADGNSQERSAPAVEAAELGEQIDEWEPPAPFYDFELPEFPIEALPTWLRSFVESEASSTQTPLALSAMLALAVCAAAIARKVRILIRAGWQEPLNLFTAIALPPGNRKSQVVTDTTQPLLNYERKLIRETREQIAAERTAFRILQGEVTELEKRAARAEPDRAAELIEQAKAKARELEGKSLPYFPKLIVDDVTPEVLATILAEQDGRIALFSAEGGIFDTLAGRYTNGMVNIDVVLKGHSGDDVRVDRKDRSETIDQPALTMGLAVQPDILRGLMEKPGFRGRGLIGRFLYCLPQSTLGRRKIRPGSILEEVRSTYHRQISSLAHIQPFTNDDGETEPKLIRLSKDADDVLAAFEEEIEPMLGPDGDLASMSDWGGKLVGATVRIAGILHLAYHTQDLDQQWPNQVSADTLQKAIAIARYLIPHARMAYAEMGSDQKVEDAKTVLRWIEKLDELEFTKRDAFRAMRRRFRQVASIEPVLKVLEDHGYIRSDGIPAERNRGRQPSERFLVNPLLKVEKTAP